MIPSLNVLQWFAVACGVVAFGLAAWKSVYFWRLQTPLSRALSLDVGSEFIATGATLAFGLSAALGHILLVDPYTECAIRVVICSSAALTTWHIGRTLRYIEEHRR